MSSDTLPTMGDTIVTGEILPVDLAVGPIEDATDARYTPRAVIGVGGMGEIHLCKDLRLGREIAMKVLRGQREPQHEIRFLREAYLQGQLEHPAIVPVYDAGRRSNGQAYFTMKRVRGMTLEQILKGLKDGDPVVIHKYSRRKLLTAFSGVCLAMNFVHARGVIHRDLKPANIILGDFGEAYVLDWGVAKVLSSESLDGDTPLPRQLTIQGSLVGTPGYMAPEQLGQGIGELTQSIDVYALGCILFELLTLQHLNVRGTLMETIQATLSGGQRPSSRAPSRDIPPELDAICTKATEKLPGERYASARELSEAIERFLDGDLDLEKRKDASYEATLAGEEAMKLAASSAPEAEGEHRAEAMRKWMRALALDPSNDRALKSMVRLFLNPPRVLPREAQKQLETLRSDAQRAAATSGSKGVLAFFTLASIMAWMGVRDWVLTGVVMVLVLALAVTAFLDSRARRPGTTGRTFVTLIGLVVLAVSTRIAGPFVCVPAFAIALIVPLSMTSPKAHWKWILAAGTATMMIPATLELAGVLPSSYEIKDGMFCVIPQMIAFPKVPAMIGIASFAVIPLVVTTFVCTQIFATHLEAEEKLRLHEWYMRKLLTGEASSAG